MKKMFKTLVAICLTVAMLSSLFVGVTFAADTVPVEWYGFDVSAVTVALGEGTYASPQPSFFPANATEKAVTWSVSDETLASVDEQGVVTLLGAGTVKVYAALEDQSKLVKDPAFKDSGVFKGAAYELTITDAALKASPAEVNFVATGKTKDVEVVGAQGPLEVVSSSNEYAVTAAVSEGIVQVTSVAAGYSVVKVTDGVSELEIPVYVLPADMSTAQNVWAKIFPDAETATTADPGYLQWWLECIPINKAASGINAGAGVLGYGEPLLNAQNLTISSAANTSKDGQNKTYFRWINDGYNYYNMNSGRGMTVAGFYQMLAIRAPKTGTVNIKPKAMEMATNSTSDGSYIAIFKTDADGKMWRVFPAETASDEYKTDTNAYAILNVTRNWLWVYPSETRFGKFKVGDDYQGWDSGLQQATTYKDPAGDPYTLTQEMVDMRTDFMNNGFTFEVKAGETIRVVQHCGAEGNSDGMTFLPIFNYVDKNVNGVLESETSIEIEKEGTASFVARLDPISTTAPIALEPAYANGTVVTLDSAVYREGSESNTDNYGRVDITLKADATSKTGVGYYRVFYGNYSQLIAVSVVASASGDSSDTEEGEEPGVEVVLGQGASGGDDGSDDDGSGDDGSGDGGSEAPEFEYTFNDKMAGITVDNPSTPNAFNGKFTWKYTNSNNSAVDYVMVMLYGTRDGSDINLSSLPVYGKKEASASASVSAFSDSYKGDFTPAAAHFPKNGGTADLFWFYGSFDDLAKNGLNLIGMKLGFTR